jgi:hypothetical protein
MFRAIVEKMVRPSWASNRYARLLSLDCFLEGSLYNHLGNPFHIERDGSGRRLPMEDRIPNVQLNFPKQVAVRTSRKLFAGRQKPQFVHDNEKLIESLDVLLREGFWDEKMMTAVRWGSVGSVFMTFQILLDGRKQPRAVFDVWRARDCTPVFDDLGELRSCRVQYVVNGNSFTSVGVNKDVTNEDIAQDKNYWFTRDYTTTHVTTYRPIKEADYLPNDKRTFHFLQQEGARIAKHDLGFVPGHWFRNLPGGSFPDGDSTWACAAEAMVVLDYTISQCTRGLWYNACPEIVLEGELANQTYMDQGAVAIPRGPSNVLQFPSIKKDAAGQQMGGGKAYLLESTGAIFEQGRENIEQLAKFIKEQVMLSRKDPDRMRTTAQSGRAMEILDDDLNDLVQDLRMCYGDNGMVPLIRKVVRAAVVAKHPAFDKSAAKQIEEVTQKWPPLYLPSTREVLELAQGLDLASGGGAGQGTGSGSGSSGGGGSGSGTTNPAPKPLKPLLDRELAGEHFAAILDLPKRESAGVTNQQVPVGEPAGDAALMPPVPEPASEPTE